MKSPPHPPLSPEGGGEGRVRGAFHICVIVPNPCLPVGRDVIRDFWTFSEISLSRNDKWQSEK